MPSFAAANCSKLFYNKSIHTAMATVPQSHNPLWSLLQSDYYMIDCSHAVDVGTATWPGSFDFTRCPLTTYEKQGLLPHQHTFRL